MSTAVVDVDLLNPARITEAQTALHEAVAAADPNLRAYNAGLVIGYLVAFGVLPDEERQVAKATWHARCRPFDEVSPPMLEAEAYANVYRASGILFGFSAATSDRQDAVECVLCRDRILADTDREAWDCPLHGWVCGDECRREVCDLRSETCTGGA